MNAIAVRSGPQVIYYLSLLQSPVCGVNLVSRSQTRVWLKSTESYLAKRYGTAMERNEHSAFPFCKDLQFPVALAGPRVYC